MSKIIFELAFIKDMYKMEEDGLLKSNSIDRVLEIAIDNCTLMNDREFYDEYGWDANPEDFCYEVIFSGEYIESYWFSINNFWNTWDEFKSDEILNRFG